MNSPKELPLDASTEDILKHLGIYKIHALNFALKTMTDTNAVHLEPKEVKILTDIVLSLEDSISVEDSEGKQARTVKRLFDRYTTNEEGQVLVKSMGMPIGLEGRIL